MLEAIDNTMSRVFVTGGAGYIGSHTVLDLLRADHAVLSFDNYHNSSSEALRRVHDMAGGALTVVDGDICDRAVLDATIGAFQPDAVIHFAGLKAVGESTQMPLAYYRNNVYGTVELLDSMQAHGCKRIVFSSSATVYGDALYLPIDENHPVQPTNPYGRTKAYIEEIIRDWGESYAGASSVLLRYFNPTGADASGRIGEDPNGIPNNLMPYVAQVASGKLERLGVFGDCYDTHDGTGERDYIHVSDLARAHLDALEYTANYSGCEAINVGTGQGATVLDMVQSFERVTGCKVPYRIEPARPGDVSSSTAKIDKAAKLLDWRARFSIEDMCASMWKWQSNNPVGYSE